MSSISVRNKKVAVNRWIRIQTNFNKLLAIQSIKYPDLKARIMGYLIGDGSVSVRKEKNGNKHFSITFYPDDTIMLYSFLFSIKKIYCISPSVKNLGKYYRVRFDSKPAVIDLLTYTKFGSLDWTIPQLLTLYERKEFLKAFFDCEAHVTHKTIVVQSVNMSGLIGISKMLEEFDIGTRIYTYTRKNPNWNKNYILIISLKESRQNFLKHIGFYHHRKQTKLQDLFAGVA